MVSIYHKLDLFSSAYAEKREFYFYLFFCDEDHPKEHRVSSFTSQRVSGRIHSPALHLTLSARRTPPLVGVRCVIALYLRRSGAAVTGFPACLSVPVPEFWDRSITRVNGGAVTQPELVPTAGVEGKGTARVRAWATSTTRVPAAEAPPPAVSFSSLFPPKLKCHGVLTSQSFIENMG